LQKRNDFYVLFRLKSSTLNPFLQRRLETMIRTGFTFRLPIEASGIWIEYSNRLTHRLGPLNTGSGWCVKLAGGSACQAYTKFVSFCLEEVSFILHGSSIFNADHISVSSLHQNNLK
jgi:hypothetical protein